jgi:hypothetical protein
MPKLKTKLPLNLVGSADSDWVITEMKTIETQINKQKVKTLRGLWNGIRVDEADFRTAKKSLFPLKTLIKESVKEVLDVELMKLRAFLIPYVSLKEQKEIETLYEKPSRKIAETFNVKI